MTILFEGPQHPDLQAVLRSTPRFGGAEGQPDLCGSAMPALTPLAPGQHVACYKRGSGPEPARTAGRA